MKKILGKSVWYGEDLQNSSCWKFSFSTEELDEIDVALKKVSNLSDLESITPKTFLLPITSKKLKTIQIFIEENVGIVLLKKFPREKYTTEEITIIFWALSQYIGTPISQTPTGEKIFNVRDVGFPKGHPKSRGPNTKNKLSFHTDRCDVIGFFCVEKAMEGGENLIVSSATLHNEILENYSNLLPVLYQTFYNKRHNFDAGNELPYCQLPVFSVHEGYFATNIMRVLIFRAHEMKEVPDLTSLQIEALEKIEELAHDPKMHIKFTLDRGDILFVNNFINLHSRTEFNDFDAEAKKRNFLRLWLSVPNSRPLSPLFAPNYGNTNAGAIRGGIKSREI